MANMTAMERNEIIIPAYATATIDFNRTRPNYFSISNRGDGTVYASTKNLPTLKHYDMRLDADKTKVLVDPYPCTFLYLYNSTGNDIKISVTSWADDFDPVVAALQGFEVSVNVDDITTTSIISGFQSPLPIGSNKIGSVDVASALPQGANKIGSVDIASALPEGANKIGNVSIVGELPQGNNSIGIVRLDHYSSLSLANDVVEGLRKSEMNSPCAIIGSGSTTFTVNTTAKTLWANDVPDQYTTINFLTNDGTSNIIVSMGGESFILKPSETIQSLRIPLNRSLVVNTLSGTSSIRFALFSKVI